MSAPTTDSRHQHDEDDPLRAACILIVDDKEPNVVLLAAILEGAGYRTIHSLTEARHVAAWCAAHQPDLIILDLHMPHLDGFGVMEQLASLHTAAEYLPILVVTADLTREIKRRALAVGAKDVVTKPFDRAEVLLRVKTLLQTRRLYQQHQHQHRALEEQLSARTRQLEQTLVARDQLSAQLEHRRQHDALTGLPTRLVLEERIQDALQATPRDHLALALLVLDLDRFTQVNDTLGHGVGDLLLQQVSARIRGVLRGEDLLARLGGDTFAVLLPRVGGASAVWAARKILAALATPFALQGHHVDAGASIGVACAPDDGADAGALLRKAEVAMYVAKRKGSGFVQYTAAQDQHSVFRLTLGHELREAIAQQRLVLHYQPKVLVRRGSVSGVEALVRWPHPQHGLIPPDEFISLAEQNGLIGPLTQWVVQASLQQCQRWHQAGLQLDVAVNLSMHTLDDARLPDTIGGLVRRYAIAPDRVTLEVTESALGVDPARIRTVMLRLREMGFRLAIDDFGTGYSTLDQLKQLPVHEIKIDKSFVLGMAAGETDASAKDTAIVRSVIQLGHNLGLSVVAEGVETQLAWEVVGEMGCPLAQGYYASRPLPAAELEHWMRTSLWGKRRVSA